MWHERYPSRSDDYPPQRTRSYRPAETRAWAVVEQALAEQRTLPGLVEDYNRGGLLVAVGQIRGFLPASHLSSGSKARMDWKSRSEERFEALVGLTLQVRVIDLDRSRNHLILSEREARDPARTAPNEPQWHVLAEGDVRTGTVTDLAPFGAMVDLGGVEGLIHVSELSWSKVNHPSEILNKGDEVKVKVLWKDPARRRIGLSLRQLQDNPWETLVEHHRPGDLVWCRITRIEDYGAFAELEAHPVEGLIHISELSSDMIDMPEEVVVVEDEVQVKILALDPERRRLSLSLKQADPTWTPPTVAATPTADVDPAAHTEFQTAEELLATQAIVTCVVVDYNRGGLLVAVGSLQGFIPASHLRVESQMLLDRTSNTEERFVPLLDETLEVKVIDQDPRHNQLILSEKEAQRASNSQDLADLLEDLELGEIRDGVVSSLTEFGAIVNIGELDGLIHVSELSWSMVNHPAEILGIGEYVQVKIIQIDKERRRIGLSLRQLHPNPWETLTQRYQEGDVAWATITRVERWGAFARLEDEEVVGLIHVSEMSEEPVHDVDELVTVDEDVEVRIISLDTENRRMGLSLKQVDMAWQPNPVSAVAAPAAHADAGDMAETAPLVPEDLRAQRQVVECKVVNANRGGVLAVLGPHRGFIPTSHLSLDSLKRLTDTPNPVQRYDPLLGETLHVLVIDVDDSTRQLILSEKEALRALHQQDKEAVLAELEIGATREGIVSSVARFGAFVNIGELDGLIHISELSWSIVDHPSEVLNVGDRIQVKIIAVDQDRQHIGLSLRQLHPNPWNLVDDQYREGDIVQVTVVQTTAWGALVHLQEQQGKGRIYRNEMREDRLDRPDGGWDVGEVVEAKIVSLDATNPEYPLILSERKALRTRSNQRRDEVLADLEVGAVIQAVVTRLVRYGAFVDIEGAAGLIHISELSWSKVNHPSQILHVGDPVRAKVISLDQERKHVGLSLRQMIPNPWEKLAERYPVGQWVDVTATRFIPQGVLAQLANESVEGLIYHSEMNGADEHAADEALVIGERLRARILFVDPERRHIGLSLQPEQSPADPEAPDDPGAEYRPATAWGQGED